MDNGLGSGDSEPSMIAFEKTWQQLKRQMEYEEEALRRVPNDWPLEKRTAYWMYLTADNEGWEAGKIACMSGSPRKVGEDGALKADDYRLVPVRLIQRFGAGVPGNEADTRWTVCLPNGDYAHIFPEYLLAQPTPQASSEIREARVAAFNEAIDAINGVRFAFERSGWADALERVIKLRNAALAPSRQGAG